MKTPKINCKRRLLIFLVLVVYLFAPGDLCAQLQDAQAIQISIPAHDIIYDRTRRLIYASIDSSDGFPNGNSIVSLDPDTLEIVDSVFIGSEPGQMAISFDDSRVYVGIDGARAIRYWEPETSEIGPLNALFRNSVPAIAEDIAVSPIDPKVVVVSKDEVFSTADGALEIFDDTGSIYIDPSFTDSNSITFVNDTTMATFNNSDTGFDLQRYSFDGSSLTFEDEVSGLVAGFSVQIEASNEIIFGTDGTLANPFTLTGLGNFNASGALEPIALDSTTYFYSSGILRLFDNNTFLQIDSINLGGPSATELILAGTNRLAYVTNTGQVGVISMIPASAALPQNVSATELNIIRGQQVAGDLDDVGQSDDMYLEFLPGITLSPSEPPVWLEFSTTLSTDDPAILQFTVESRANTAGLAQEVEAFDFDTGQFELVDSRDAETSDSQVSIDLTNNATSFIQAGTGSTIVRLSYRRQQGPIKVFPWRISIDQILWTVVPD